MTTTTRCYLIKITRVDTAEVGLTNLDQDVVYSGLTYQTEAGHTPTNYLTSDSLGVNNLDVEALLSVVGVTRDDIRAGLYDGARMDLLLWDYEAASLVRVIGSGHWGECTVHHGSGRYIAEYRSLTQKLQQPIGEVVSPLCLAELGDTRCGVNLTLLTVTGDVDSSTDARNFVAAELTQAAGYFDGGIVTWTSGNNDTYEMEVKRFTTGGNVELYMSMANDIVAGDDFSIRPGCDKTFTTCKGTYNNIVNRRAFDYVPGPGSMTERTGV